jgi:hypothetical protein
VFLQAWADSWRKWHFDVEDVRDAEGEHVFVAIHEWGIGVESGASVDQRRYSRSPCAEAGLCGCGCSVIALTPSQP